MKFLVLLLIAAGRWLALTVEGVTNSKDECHDFTIARRDLCIIPATCINDYGGCKSQHCEVRLRIEPGWICGRIRSAENGADYASFRSVPYAKPPLGPRRFKELEPVDPWDDSIMLDAMEDSAICPQTDFIFGKMALHPKGMSEDCLYLNLHVPYAFLPTNPSYRPRKPLPILVFIHGGAFQSGSGLSDYCGPEYLMTQNIIVITFNYRLNVFGFLSLNTAYVPGNQGLRDILTVLRWVQTNAYMFGGDPENVTLMGQSAGGTAAHLLALSPAAKGLFKRFIAISGYAFPSYFTTSPKYANNIAKMFLKELNITATDPQVIHEELTKVPLLTLMQTYTGFQYRKDFVFFGPVVESSFPGVTRILDEDPLTLIANGRGKEYPQIITFTNNEMAISKWGILKKGILELLENNPAAIVSNRLQYSLSQNELAEATRKIYKRYFKGKPTLDEMTHYLTDMYLKHPALKLAEWKVSLGGAPIYLAKFSYELLYSPVKVSEWLDFPGASHMEDISLIFRVNSMLGNYIGYPPKNRDDVMKIWMVFLVSNFMKCGNPSCVPGNGPWPPIQGKVLYSELKEPLKVEIYEPNSYEWDLVRFFDDIDPQVRNISDYLRRG